MGQDPEQQNGVGWLEASGLPHILRTLGLAVQPAKLGIALVAIIFTFAWGALLDLVWAPGGVVPEEAITQFIQARESDQPYEESPGTQGIFEVWREHERDCVLGLLSSSLPGSSVAGGTPLGTYIDRHTGTQPLRNVAGMFYGVWWLVQYHIWFFILFAVGALLIWSWCGGAICRMAAVQSAHGDKLTMREALGYGRERLLGGFFLAPWIPIAFILITLVLMILGGAVLRIPVFGDVICGIAFGFAILGGFVVAFLALGLLVGGSFLWPAVAVEGSDGFDAFSRSLSYPLSKPWKWVLYAVIALVYASICWVIVNVFTYVTLVITRAVVSFGTSPFGWWSRGEEAAPISKLEMLWPIRGPNAWFVWPDTGGFAWWEYISAFLIAAWVLLVIGLMWSFLASFYFSGSTVVYYLLRRDVDGINMDDVFVEEDKAATEAAVSTTQPTETEPSAPSPGGESGGGTAPAVEPGTGPSEEPPSDRNDESK